MWIMPTYRRQAQCQEALDSIKAIGCATPGIVLVNGDQDPAYANLVPPPGWAVVRFDWENKGALAALNAIATMKPDEPWYGFISDDARVRSPGWDTALVREAGDWFMASCGDGWQDGKRLSGAIVWGGQLLRSAGFWSPPELIHSFFDDCWEEIGKRLQIWKIRRDILVEHMHPWCGKGQDDEVYQRSYATETMRHDQEVWNAWKAANLEGTIARIFSDMKQAAIKTLREIEQGQVEKIRGRRLMIATPMYRGVEPIYVQSLVRTIGSLHEWGVEVTFLDTQQQSMIAAARNTILMKFVESECDDLLMIDDDMGWMPSAVLRILASDKDLVAVAGRRRDDRPNSDVRVWCVAWPTEANKEINQAPTGEIEVEAVGTGFMRISRRCAEKMYDAYKDLECRLPDGSYRTELFAYSVDERTKAPVGEDYTFCRRWKAIGGQVWVIPDVPLSHIGPRNYSGTLAEVLVSEQPTGASA